MGNGLIFFVFVFVTTMILIQLILALFYHPKQNIEFIFVDNFVFLHLVSKMSYTLSLLFHSLIFYVHNSICFRLILGRHGPATGNMFVDNRVNN